MVLLDFGVLALVSLCPSSFTSYFIAHLEFYIDVFEYVSLSFQIMCVRSLWRNAACLQKGKGSRCKTRIYLGPGDLAVGNLAICTDF